MGSTNGEFYTSKTACININYRKKTKKTYGIVFSFYLNLSANGKKKQKNKNGNKNKIQYQ